MTNKESIEIIKSECYVFNPLNFDRSTMVNTALDMAIDSLERSEKFRQKAEVVISQLRADRDRLEDAHRWIPVYERLPEEGGDYLTTVKGIVSNRYEILSFTKNLYKVDEYDFPDKKEPGWYFLDREYGFIEETDVIAWMPLPEIYKAESNKGE
jgi:hypothetical protein